MTTIAIDVFGDMFKACFCLMDFLLRFYIPTKKEASDELNKKTYENLDIFIKTYFCYLEENQIPIKEIKRLLTTVLTEDFERNLYSEWYVNVQHMLNTDEYESWRSIQDERTKVTFIDPAKQAIEAINSNNIPFSKEQLDLYENVALTFLSNQFHTKNKKFLSFLTGMKIDGERITDECETLEIRSIKDIPNDHDFNYIFIELDKRVDNQKKITK